MCNLLVQLTNAIGDLNARLEALSAAANATVASQALLFDKNKRKGVTLPLDQTANADATAKNKLQISGSKVDTSKAWVCCGCQGMNNTTDDPCWRCQSKCCDCCLVKKK